MLPIQASPIRAATLLRSNQKTTTLIVALGFIVIALACGSDGEASMPTSSAVTTSSDAGKSSSSLSPKQIRLDRLEVSQGETQRFTSGSEVIVKNGIEISGRIIAEDTGGGTVTIIAEDGDIVVSGSLEIEVRESRVQKPPGSAAASQSVHIQESRVPSQGMSYELLAEKGDIRIDNTSRFFSGDGDSALDETVSSLVDGIHKGTDGGPGGDLTLRAPNGQISLPTDLSPGNTPIIMLGSGGDGANVKIGGPNFSTDAETIQVFGGNGGDSGRLKMEATVISGIDDGARYYDDNIRLLAGGSGGKGGYAVWVPEDGPIDESGWLLGYGFDTDNEFAYELERIELHGGHGGNGAASGGDGGVGGFFGGKARVGDPVPNIETSGGEGGSVFESIIPVVSPRGGDGGGFFAWGITGYDGGQSRDGDVYRHGAAGSNVDAWGGGGGDIDGSAAKFPGGRGGSGGGTGDDLAIASAGFGGFGLAGCKENGPGGDGGHAGLLQAAGGNGGSGPSGGARGEVGGTGGSIKVAGAYAGDGGDGNPPGKGGQAPPLQLTAGTGGPGTLKGQDGSVDARVNVGPHLAGKPGKNCDGSDPGTGSDSHPWDLSCRPARAQPNLWTTSDEYSKPLTRCTLQLYDCVVSSRPVGSDPNGPRQSGFSCDKNNERANAFALFIRQNPSLNPYTN